MSQGNFWTDNCSSVFFVLRDMDINADSSDPHPRTVQSNDNKQLDAKM